MSVATESPAAGRLRRLVDYLEQDPDNPALLAEIFDASLACGEHERAETCIACAERLALDAPQWQFRRARLALVMRELDRAADLLQALRQTRGEHPVLAHDLAYVHLLQGAFDSCREVVEPWLVDGGAGRLPPEQLGALQLLWLRAMHRLERLDEAMDWVRAALTAGTLQPPARGAASLIALDLEDFAAARDLAEAALAVDPRQVEALLARGSVALATGDTALAMRLLRQALEHNPDDGRTWSALGMASLQAQDFAEAESQLGRAVHNMPGHVGTWHALGWARLLQGDRSGALAAFHSALEIDRNFAETHGGLGLVLALSGDADASRRHLDIADRLDSSNVTGRYARALIGGQAGDRASLERLAKTLLQDRGMLGGTLGDAVASQSRARD